MLSSDAVELPLTAAQRGVWVGQQLNPTRPLYNIGEYIDLPGPLDISLFEKALRQAVAEAEALHVRFVADACGVTQVLRPAGDWPLPIIDLSGEADPAEAARSWMRADLDTVVDLERDRLFGHALFAIAANRFFWYQRAHHICVDGYSFSLVPQRTAQLYKDPGHPAGLGGLRAVVDDDLAYQNSARRDEDRDFWCAYFADRPEVVSLSERTSVACSPLLRHHGPLPAHVLDALRCVADPIGATWPRVVFALAAIQVRRCTGPGEVVLGVPIMQRRGFLRVPSMIMNVLALRIPIGDCATLSDVVRVVSAELSRTSRHRRYRFEHLRRDLKLLGGGRRLYGPLVNVMPFDYDLDFGGHHTVAHNLAFGAGFLEDIAITLDARSDGGPPTLYLDANPDCYSPTELAVRFNNFMDMLANPEGWRA